MNKEDLVVGMAYTHKYVDYPIIFWGFIQQPLDKANDSHCQGVGVNEHRSYCHSSNLVPLKGYTDESVMASKLTGDWSLLEKL